MATIRPEKVARSAAKLFSRKSVTSNINVIIFIIVIIVIFVIIVIIVIIVAVFVVLIFPSKFQTKLEDILI